MRLAGFCLLLKKALSLLFQGVTNWLKVEKISLFALRSRWYNLGNIFILGLRFPLWTNSPDREFLKLGVTISRGN